MRGVILQPSVERSARRRLAPPQSWKVLRPWEGAPVRANRLTTTTTARSYSSMVDVEPRIEMRFLHDRMRMLGSRVLGGVDSFVIPPPPCKHSLKLEGWAGQNAATLPVFHRELLCGSTPCL